MTRSVPLLWAIIGALVLLGAMGWCHKPVPPLVPPVVQTQLDSLDRTHAADSLRLDSLQRIADALGRRGDSAATRARAAEAAAAALHTKASAAAELAAAAELRDSVTRDSVIALWRAAYDDRTVEADSLRTGLARALAASDDHKADADSLRPALREARARNTALDGVNAGLRAALGTAAKRDRLFGVIPEPSRKVVAVVAAVIGFAGGLKAR